MHKKIICELYINKLLNGDKVYFCVPWHSGDLAHPGQLEGCHIGGS
jgi:hypothetical protein